MFITRFLLVLTLFSGASAFAQAPDPAPNMTSTGTRYWEVIRTYVDPEAKGPRRSLYQRRAGQDRVFNFDRVSMLDASFLLLAARASIHRTRYEMGGSTEQEMARQFVQNFDLCLQYYPILAKSDEDFESVLNGIRHLRGNRYFRDYLIRRSVPGLASKSLFAEYLQENLAPRRRMFTTLLQKNLMYKDEDPVVADASMDALMQMPRNDLLDALAADPAVQAYEKETGQDFDLALLAREDGPSLSPATQAACRQAFSEISSLARFLNDLRSPDKVSSPYVRDKMAENIRRLCETYPLGDKAEILALITEDDNA